MKLHQHFIIYFANHNLLLVKFIQQMKCYNDQIDIEFYIKDKEGYKEKEFSKQWRLRRKLIEVKIEKWRNLLTVLKTLFFVV